MTWTVDTRRPYCTMSERREPALFDPDLLTPADQEILGSMEKAVSVAIYFEMLSKYSVHVGILK